MTSSSSADESEKRLIVESADGQPTRYYLGGRITAEGVAWLYERLTGKKMSPEGLEEGRRTLAEARAKLDHEHGKSGECQEEGQSSGGGKVERSP